MGRVKVRVPALHGISGQLNLFVQNSELPWCLPAGMPAGGDPESGAFTWIPIAGDQVWIRFLDGDLSKPIWEWGNINRPQSAKYAPSKIHAYESDGSPVRRGGFSRFRHWTEFKPDGVRIFTANDYLFEVYDSPAAGRLLWRTAKGYFSRLDDSTEEFSASAPTMSWSCETSNHIATQRAEITTPVLQLSVGSIQLGSGYSRFELDATGSARFFAKFQGLTAAFGSTLYVSAPNFVFTTGGLSGVTARSGIPGADSASFSMMDGITRLGVNAIDPLVRMSDLVKALQTVKRSFDTHTHGGSRVPDVPAAYTAYATPSILTTPTAPTSTAVQAANA